jgi:hypothetical protein
MNPIDDNDIVWDDTPQVHQTSQIDDSDIEWDDEPSEPKSNLNPWGVLKTLFDPVKQSQGLAQVSAANQFAEQLKNKLSGKIRSEGMVIPSPANAILMALSGGRSNINIPKESDVSDQPMVNKLQALLQSLPNASVATPGTYFGQTQKPRDIYNAGVAVATDPRSYINPGTVGATEGAVGAVTGVRSGLSKLVPQSVKNATTQEVNFLSKVRDAIQSTPRAARSQFADDLLRLNNEAISAGKPSSVNVRGMVDDLLGQIQNEEVGGSVRRAIRTSPKLQKMLNNPQTAENLTLKESQELLNEVKSVLSNAKLGGSGNRPTDIPLYEDVINEITDAQLSTHPEFAKTKTMYGDVMNDYRLIKNKIKPGSLSKNIKSKFGDKEVFAAVSRLLEKNPDVLKQMSGFRTVDAIKKALAVLAGSTGAGYLFNAGGKIVDR